MSPNAHISVRHAPVCPGLCWITQLFALLLIAQVRASPPPGSGCQPLTKPSCAVSAMSAAHATLLLAAVDESEACVASSAAAGSMPGARAGCSGSFSRQHKSTSSCGGRCSSLDTSTNRGRSSQASTPALQAVHAPPPFSSPQHPPPSPTSTPPVLPRIAHHRDLTLQQYLTSRTGSASVLS